MKQLLTKGMVLRRTDYGEADRIVTVLTPEQGKLRLMARGVRKPKSKLAAGIELFSTADLSYIKGRGEIGTLISARLTKHYPDIVKDINRVQLGYELIKMLDRATEDQPEADYYELLEQACQALNDHDIGADLIRLWFESALLRLSGHSPNLHSDAAGQALRADQTYNFDFETVAFVPHANSKFKAEDIKFLRLLFSGSQPRLLAKVTGLPDMLANSRSLVQTMLATYIRL